MVWPPQIYGAWLLNWGFEKPKAPVLWEVSDALGAAGNSGEADLVGAVQ